MLVSNLELLLHIKEETEFILAHTEKSYQLKIEDDEIMSRAFIRSLEVIGEASKKISDEIKSDYPFVEWKKMTGLRDKLIHDYFGIDYDIVQDVIVQKIPPLNDFIAQIITDVQKRIENEK